MTLTVPKQDEINEMIELTEWTIRDLMSFLLFNVFNKMNDKSSGHFETFFPCLDKPRNLKDCRAFSRLETGGVGLLDFVV